MTRVGKLKLIEPGWAWADKLSPAYCITNDSTAVLITKKLSQSAA